MIGSRLAHYEITAHLGSGGMGDVYQATDTKLGRNVAIKLLPAAFASDAERLSRFRREAQALAALNHLNIAQIYGIEDTGGTSCIVMELVEGETLQARIERGPIPTAEALSIAKQIAEALEAAHEKGVIHRDLKPGNIMLDDGKVKVLDFGLAKAYDTPSSNTDLAHSPTLTGMAATSAGVILGTAAYMSPEQAKGRAVDRRTDIFAFGCVLYEMLTAKKAFDGEDVTDILGAVLRIEPDWNQLPDGVPVGVRRLLRLCLEKNPKNRRSDATDIRLDLDHLLNEPATATAVPAPVEIPARPLWARAAQLAAALVLGGIISGAAIWALRPSAAPGAVTRFPVTLPQDQSFSNVGRKVIAVSPDGSAMVYLANQRLYYRRMSELEARPIAGTETWTAAINPVFSPDGRSLAFWASSDRTLKRIAVTGGAAVTLCPVDLAVYGLSWSEGVLVFGQGAGGIYRVSDNGGKPERLVSVKDNELAHGPQILPGGKAFLYTVRAADADWDKAKIFVRSFEPGSAPQLLIDGGREARFVSTGHIVYAYQGTLFAIPFDVNELKRTGGPTPVVEGVRNSGTTTGTSQFSVADNGTLIFVPGPLSGGNSGALRTLAYRDRSRNELERLKIPPGSYSFPRVSPDGTRVAVSTDDDKPEVWIIDLAGGSAPRQLTLGGNSRNPVWLDDLRVAFRTNRAGDDAIFWQKADGTGTAQRLTKAEPGTFHVPGSTSTGGKFFAYSVVRGGSATVSILSLDDGKVTIFEERASLPEFSPNGRWLAYQDQEAPQRRIFVQPFPATGAMYPIVTGGQPFWSADGSELFYNPAPQQIGVIRINTTPAVSLGEPSVFSTAGLLSRSPQGNPRLWDVAPDRKRLIGVTDATEFATSGEAATQQIHVVLNWFTDLKARVPN